MIPKSKNPKKPKKTTTVSIDLSSNAVNDPQIRPLEIANRIFQTSRTNYFYKYFSEERGIKPETLNLYKVGYCPPWLVECIPAELIQPLMAVQLLERNNRGRVETRYGNLFTFPYLSFSGICGFQFREVDTYHAPEELSTRYCNLTYTNSIPYPPYKIGKPSFYGLPTLEDEMTVVEGPTDVHLCHQAGLPNPQGLCGLTIKPDDFLKAVAGKKVFLMLDWDAEGRRKTFQIALTYLQRKSKRGTKLIIVKGPWGKGKDPADLSQTHLLDIFANEQLTPEKFAQEWLYRSIDQDDPTQKRLASKLLGG